MVVGDDAALLCGETKDGECLCGAGIVFDISVGVTGEEIGSVDGVFGVFCAVGECCFNACEFRDVVNRSERKGVRGSSGCDAISDVVGEVDGAVEVLAGSECPACASWIQCEGTSGITVSVGGDEISDIEGLLLAVGGVAVGIGEASEELLIGDGVGGCLLYTSPSPRDDELSRMPSSA